MAGRKSDFTLTRLDDLFTTQEQRDDEKLSKIRDIPLTEIDDLSLIHIFFKQRCSQYQQFCEGI